MRVPSLRNGGMRAAREGGGGGMHVLPQRKEGWRDAGHSGEGERGFPPIPGERKDGGKPSPRSKDGGLRKEERTEGSGEEREGGCGPCWGQRCSERTEGRGPVPARDARCLLRAGVLSREQESLPSFFPPFHAFHHFLCVFCVYSSLFPPILAESKASQVTIYMNRQVFLAVILFRKRLSAFVGGEMSFWSFMHI